MVLLAAVLLCGCSSVGPGFANHPLDCAIGVKWADCLPGTAGYNNGGGQQTRAEEAKQQNAALNEQMKAVGAQCKSDFQTPELDVIRKKIELHRESGETPPPFEIASNDTFPNEVEHVAIMKWAKLRDDCMRRAEAAAIIPASSTAMQVAFIQQDRSFAKEAGGRVTGLIVALYQQKLTYGEFAQKRYEITRDAMAAERQFRQATLIADQQRKLQAEQLAQQQFQNNLVA